VLVIDLYRQGSMASIFNGKIDEKWQTVFPLLARNYG
jgi:chromosome partitioning protein